MAVILQWAGYWTAMIFIAFSLLAQPDAAERLTRIEERMASITERVGKLDAVDANIRLSKIEGQLDVIEKLLYALLAAFGGLEAKRWNSARRQKGEDNER